MSIPPVLVPGDDFMSYLGSHHSHGSAYNVVNYCLHGHKGESRERALAIDSNYIPEEDIENGVAWKAFDRVAKRYGTDKGYHGKKAVTYCHYVIAPNPEDFKGAGKDEMLAKVRQCARSWAMRCVPDQQWLIVYHDDSACSNIHAHIIVGNTNMKTHRKCHVSKRDVAEQRRILDEESRRAGLEALGDRLIVKQADKALEERNSERRERGEREIPKTVTSRQTTQREVMTKAERYMRDGQSWKARLRQIVDECAWESDSFSGFQQLMRYYGCTATIKKSGQITYTIGDRRCSARKLGLMYQTDFLASQFMDLRFTKAGWAAERGRWRQARDAGLRVPKVSDKDLESLFPKMEQLGIYDGRSAAACVAQCREKAREALNQHETLERNLATLSKDLDDAHLVEAMKDGVEKGRIGGRIHLDKVIYAEDAVRRYEAARKRLERRRYATDASSLERRYAETMSALADARAQDAKLTRMLKDALDVQRILAGMGAALDRAQENERLRYGSRLADQRRAEARTRHSREAGHVPARIVYVRADGTRSDAGMPASLHWQDPAQKAKEALFLSLSQKQKGPVEIPLLEMPEDLFADPGNGVTETSPTPFVQPPKPVQEQKPHPAPLSNVPAPSVNVPSATPSRGYERLIDAVKTSEPAQQREPKQVAQAEQQVKNKEEEHQ